MNSKPKTGTEEQGQSSFIKEKKENETGVVINENCPIQKTSFDDNDIKDKC